MINTSHRLYHFVVYAKQSPAADKSVGRINIYIVIVYSDSNSEAEKRHEYMLVSLVRIQPVTFTYAVNHCIRLQ